MLAKVKNALLFHESQRQQGIFFLSSGNSQALWYGTFFKTKKKSWDYNHILALTCLFIFLFFLSPVLSLFWLAVLFDCLFLWHPLRLSLLSSRDPFNEWFNCSEWVVEKLRLGLLREQKEWIQEDFLMDPELTWGQKRYIP